VSTKFRALTTVASAALLAAVAVIYVLLTRPPTAAPAAAGPPPEGARVVFLTNGRLSFADLADPGGPRQVTDQECDRVGAGPGVIACLRPVDVLVGTRLVIFDRSLRSRREIPLTGFPNRLRVSASGRMVAWTLFIDGHSYIAAGFSTIAGIIDTRTGLVVPTLEDFAITLDGRAYRAADVNFWGVTFTSDDNRFYATMSTGGQRYLVEGDLAARTVRTVATGVECPALSPDGTAIAFKAAVGGNPRNGWRLTLLYLASGKVVPLPETRSVDDQPYWLDGQTVAYTLQRPDGVNDVWAVPADGSGTPRLVVGEAASLAVGS
jgi:WD40-like Beta Propeller Repeat